MEKNVSVNAEQLIIRLSNSIIALAKQCISTSGQFSIALSGGNTPKLLYQYFIAEKLFDALDLSKVFIYFSDERYVSHDDIRSNFASANLNLLGYLNIPTENIFAVNTSFDNVAESAQNYQKIINHNIKADGNDNPSFDLILLGMGADGHTASLFPKSDLLHSSDALVGSCYHQESNTDRISFTLPLINAAKNVYIVTLGKEKHAVLRQIRESEQSNVVKYPVQCVKPIGNLSWFTDYAAEYGD